LHALGLHRRDEIELTKIMDYFSQLPDYHHAGAIACFLGVVREDSVRETNDKVTHLEYEAYAEVALKRMEEIRKDMCKRSGIIEVSIHHVIDRLKVGEPSLFVAVLGTHRQEVFPVLSETVERVKKEVPIWKKEFTSKDSYWVATDHA
jgi:molybdopterin synthase catalytic subunit